MFLAGDQLENREERIRTFLVREPAIAILLASASFEWSVSRAIIREFIRCYGLKAYKKLWRAEVVSCEYPECLVDVVPDWQALISAFEMRGGLIHGKITCTRNTASPKVQVLLDATRGVADYFERRGARLNDVLPVRPKKRGDT